MDKLRIPAPSNGVPLNWDDLDFAFGLGAYSKGVINAIEGVIKSSGDNLIVYGCGVTGSDIAEGWVLIAGILVKVDAHTATGNYFEVVTTYNSAGNKQTQIGGTEDIYQQNRATATASSGTLASPVTGSPLTFIRPATSAEALLPDSSELNVLLSPYNLRQAFTNSIQWQAASGGMGVVEKASTAETQAGTNQGKYVTPYSVHQITATTTRAGLVEKATTTEAQSGTPDKYIDAALLSAITGGLITTVLDIGDWNMDSTTQVFISHSLTLSKMRRISVMIRNDVGSYVYDINQIATFGTTPQGGSVRATSSQVNIYRRDGGIFDSTDFNATSYNRGWIIIESIP